jgi:hypothetical protein
MEYAILTDHWVSILRQIKDEAGHSAWQTEHLAKDILRYIRYTRFRQFALFTQRRGEEYERFIEKMVEKYPLEDVNAIIDNEEFWKTTLELASEY